MSNYFFRFSTGLLFYLWVCSVTDARDRLTGSAGVGLAITERAVQLHGGAVRTYNSPDGGLVVEIDLPLGSDVLKSKESYNSSS